MGGGREGGEGGCERASLRSREGDFVERKVLKIMKSWRANLFLRFLS